MKKLIPFLFLTACAGKVADSYDPALPSTIYADVETIPITIPNQVDSVAVACGPGEEVLQGGCELRGNGVLVGDETDGRGWACAATSADDHVTLRTWVECSR
jgi:hypothetical protein